MNAGASSVRTLVLTVDPPNLLASGAELRNLRNAVVAAQFGPVVVASVRPPHEPAMTPHERIGVVSLSFAGERRTRAVKRRTAGIEVRLTRIILRRLLDLIRDFRPDIVLVEGIPLFPMLQHIRPLVPTLILDMHNIESDLAAMIAPGQRRRGLFGLRGRSEAACIREIEGAALTTVDRVWVCSDADRKRLFAGFDVKIPVDVVPNGIPRQDEIPDELAPMPTEEAGFPVMVFVGHLAYAPNVEAAERLALNILPRVRQAFPSARQILAGRLPSPEVKFLAQLDGVELIADPNDLAVVYRRGHLSVVPLSSGGGTRIKILEAMAWGLPVVATSLAAEGHGFVAGEEIEISETDGGIAKAIIAMCSNPERLENQRRKAHMKLTREFGAETIKNAIRNGLGLAGGKT